jgi:hypothetical protein
VLVPTKAHAGLIVMVKFLSSCFPAASVTLILKAKAPETTGVPEITPETAFSESPDGRLPDVTDHVNGGSRPVHVKVYEYTANSVPFGSGLGDVIVGAGAPQATSVMPTMINKVHIVIIYCLRCFGRISFLRQ